MRLLDALSLRTRLTLAVSLLTLCALAPLNVLGRIFISDNLQAQIHATLLVEAQGLRDLVESTLAEREANARSWSEDSILRGALLFDTFDKSDAVLVALEKRHPSFAGLVLFTEEGRAVSASEERLREAYEGHEAQVRATSWFRAALNGRMDTTGVGAAGEATVTASLEGFAQLREQVGRVASSISALNERTQQIGGITQTVQDLADQSNMLALNAAIEAVRSGEHGKGFGVVAREIRSLADQSITSTGRVREILDDIRLSIQGAVRQAEQSQGSAETGLTQVRASGDSLRELTGIIQDNASAAQQIAAAVTQQNAGVAQIFTAVTDLSRMMEESMQGLQSSQRITASLREVAARMETVAATYRV
ncbi:MULTISPECIES: methyl-accepting chemotaxis protein [Myxococcus]|uniref:methyl-accepting chemotaxis protein n=1 Tax=Myxococcus TaxID=32 RepID=UPI0013D6DC0E|nr:MULTISPECIES: methyl-accepting chemotaxis protein [Myxococcus]NVJ25747.1 hypothetical protein [Myxococcus sp. AM011]